MVPCWWVTLSSLLVYLSPVAGAGPGLLSFESQQLETLSNKGAFPEPKHCLFKHWEQSTCWKKRYFKTTNSVNICLFYINSLRRCYSLLSRPVFLATLRRSLNITLVSCYWTAITELWRLHSFWNCNSLVNLWVSISSLYKHLLTATLKHLGKKNSLDWILSLSALFPSFILFPSPSYPLRKLRH